MDIFFHNFQGILRVAVTTPIVYLTVILFVRLGGKRSTSQMNNFDWVVTVAMGTVVGSTVLQASIPVLEGLTGTGLLLLLQYGVTKLSFVSSTVSRLVRATPRLLFLRGNYLEDPMRQERISHQEILAAIRAAGVHQLDHVEAVVLETDAQLSVIPTQANPDTGSAETLANVEGFRG